MKQIKKLASLLLAAVLAMTLLAGCGGRGGNVDIAITEQSLLKYINKTRANAEMGLSPVKNDPTRHPGQCGSQAAGGVFQDGDDRYQLRHRL